MNLKAAVAVAALCTLCQSAIAKPTIQTIDVAGETDTALAAINDAGTIAGTASDTTQHGIVGTADGSFTLFDPPGATYTFVTSINAAGDIAGGFDTGPGAMHCFIRSFGGVFTVFGPTSKGTFCLAGSINDKGFVAGSVQRKSTNYVFSRAPAGGIRKFLAGGSNVAYYMGINKAGTITGTTMVGSNLAGFLRTKDGTVTTFNVPGNSNDTYARSINKAGAIAGSFTENHQDQGYVRATDGAISIFDVPQAVNTDPTLLNDKGTIAGDYSTSRATKGFLRTTSGSIKTFSPTGAAYTYCQGLNNAGVIVGTYYDGSGKHGFIRTP